MNAISPLTELDTNQIDNVYIYVADCVRHDYTPDRVIDRGVSCKTAAAALCTPQSLSSIVSGRHVPRHGVVWFMHSIDDAIPTLFDLNVTTGYNEVIWPGQALQNVLGNPGRIELESVTEPFVVMEHDLGGHTPYPAFKDQSPSELLSKIPNIESLRAHYEEGIEQSTDRFEERLQILEKRGVLKNTLVIYLSDHGALLGERGGFINHGLPAAPETTYVSTVFIHDSLPVTNHETFVHHVDLFPTIAELINGKQPVDVDGESLLSTVDPDRPAYTNGVMRPPSKYRGTAIDPGYDAPSIWTADGGYIFNQTKWYVRPVTAIYDSLLSGNTGAFDAGFAPRRLVHGFRHYLKSEHTYGNPAISISKAKEMAEEISNQTINVEEHTLDEEMKEHLALLGYR